jgi:hypothetical protein
MKIKPHPPGQRALLWVRRGRTVIGFRDGLVTVVRPDGTVRRRRVNR